MSHSPRSTIVCTVGTSLLGNLRKATAATEPAVAKAFAEGKPATIAKALLAARGDDRICGAEANSVFGLIQGNYVQPDAAVWLLHSDTEEGRFLAGILVPYLAGRGHRAVHAVQVADLQDKDRRRFKVHGLRNLAREICRIIRDFGPSACALNATGGYKAQIAVAVLLGQALGVPVYYLHELFQGEVIEFPPMPVALDFGFWMSISGMLETLASSKDPIPAAEFEEDWNERAESLVDRVTIDGVEHLDLSPTGQIFHETFRHRFAASRESLLPPAVPAGEKKEPRLEDSGHMSALHRLREYLTSLTKEVPQVVRCQTFYSNPDLPKKPRFRRGNDGVEGWWSDGRALVKFRVETRATNADQENAVLALLNEWLSQRR